MKLRTRLVACYSGLFLVSASLLVVAVYATIVHKLRNDFLHYLWDDYGEVQRITAECLGDPAELRADLEIEILGNRYMPTSYRLYDESQEQVLLLIAPEWRKALAEPPTVPAAGTGPSLTKRQVTQRARDIVYFMTGRVDDGDNAHLIIELGMSYKRTYKRVESIRKRLLIMLVMAVMISVIGGRFVAARGLNPVDRIAALLEEVEAESLSKRLEVAEQPDEIGRIASSVNRMLGRLEHAFLGMKAFTADAAHELRTPLATLRCRLEVAAETPGVTGEQRQAVAESLDTVREISRLLEDLLLLARLDAELDLTDSERVALEDVLADIGELFEALASDRDVELTFKVAGGCFARGNRLLLRRLFSNLIENAVVYTPSGGRVSVVATPSEEGCTVTVRDTGPGIRPEDVPRVFERFYRVDASRARSQGGTGLGLSISRRIAELHGAFIEVESAVGAGTTFTVRFLGEGSGG